MSSFNCKTAHFFYFCGSVQFLFYCILVLKFFFTVKSRCHVGQSRSRCHNPIGSEAHMAAYKRPLTVPVRKDHRVSAKSQTESSFLSPFSQIKNHNKLRKLKNNFTNPNRFQKQIQYQIHGIHGSSQRFNDESSSLSQSSAIQALNPSPKATNSIRSQRDEIEKKRERISKVSNRRRRRITGSISDFKPKSQTESSSKNPEGSSSNLRRKHR